ncbi:hypothetical protein BGZ76_001554 [Entomortierella beljakovae]|nr:hypothetical protein BGZ76_001554 [Entomortierella beljakovae]
MATTIFTPSLKTLLNEYGPKRDSTFEITYFGILGLAAVITHTLAIAGATFKQIETKNWAEEKATRPFKQLPILKETTSDGKVFELAESEAIERYIGQKFGLTGDDLYEQTMINVFLNSTTSVLSNYYSRILNSKGDIKDEEKAKYISTTLPQWIETHERHLKASGSTGYYLGDKLSLADIKSFFLLRLAIALTGNGLISEAKTPALWKLKTNIENNANFQKYLQTEEYQYFSKKNIEFAGF